MDEQINQTKPKPNQYNYWVWPRDCGCICGPWRSRCWTSLA